MIVGKVVLEHYLGKMMKAGHSRPDTKAEDALMNSRWCDYARTFLRPRVIAVLNRSGYRVR